MHLILNFRAEVHVILLCNSCMMIVSCCSVVRYSIVWRM